MATQTQLGRIEADALAILTVLRNSAQTEQQNWAKVFDAIAAINTRLDAIEAVINSPGPPELGDFNPLSATVKE